MIQEARTNNREKTVSSINGTRKPEQLKAKE